MARPQVSRGSAVLWGSLGVGVAICLWWLVDPNAGAPSIESLETTRGKITWVHVGSDHISFRISGYENRLRFISKGGGLGRIKDALREGRENASPAVVLHDRAGFRPFGTFATTATAYQIEIDGEMIQSWEETDEAWTRDNGLVSWIAAASALGGVWLLLHAARMPTTGENQPSEGTS